VISKQQMQMQRQ